MLLAGGARRAGRRTPIRRERSAPAGKRPEQCTQGGTHTLRGLTPALRTAQAGGRQEQARAGKCPAEVPCPAAVVDRRAPADRRRRKRAPRKRAERRCRTGARRVSWRLVWRARPSAGAQALSHRHGPQGRQRATRGGPNARNADPPAHGNRGPGPERDRPARAKRRADGLGSRRSTDWNRHGHWNRAWGIAHRVRDEWGQEFERIAVGVAALGLPYTEVKVFRHRGPAPACANGSNPSARADPVPFSHVDSRQVEV